MPSRLASAAPVARVALALPCIAALACARGDGTGAGTAALPDSLPAFIGDSLPFRYPTSLYVRLIQDDVTLRLHVDEFGRPVPESTQVAEHATHAPFDTAALEGAKDLVFRPAYRGGVPVPYTILFPIKFRVPEGPPMPSDTPATVR